METAMSDLSLAIIVTGLVVIAASYGLMRLGKWFDQNREKFEQMKHKH